MYRDARILHPQASGGLATWITFSETSSACYIQRIAGLAGNELRVSERILVSKEPAVAKHAVGRVAEYSAGLFVNQSPLRIPRGASPASPKAGAADARHRGCGSRLQCSSPHSTPHQVPPRPATRKTTAQYQDPHRFCHLSAGKGWCGSCASRIVWAWHTWPFPADRAGILESGQHEQVAVELRFSCSCGNAAGARRSAQKSQDAPAADRSRDERQMQPCIPTGLLARHLLSVFCGAHGHLRWARVHEPLGSCIHKGQSECSG